MAAAISAQQFFGLQRETETAMKLLDAGLRELGRIDGANDHVHLHMLLLSSGFERLLKLTIALHRLESTGQLLTSAEIRKFKHDVRKLHDEVIRIAHGDPVLMAQPACAGDVDFMAADEVVHAVIDALTVFAPRDGRPGRYHDLELFLEAEWHDDSDPTRVWDAIESRILNDHPEIQIGSPSFNEDFWPVLARDLTRVIDRYARAVVRMWTLGSLGEPARRTQAFLTPFLLRDDQLGQVRR